MRTDRAGLPSPTDFEKNGRVIKVVASTTGLWLLAPLFVVGCGAASGHDTPLKPAQVSRAFKTTGLHQDAGLFSLFGKHQYGVTTLYFGSPPEPALQQPPVVAEIFDKLAIAKYVIKIGGNLESGSGVQIKPLARVSNVVVTLYPNASRIDRARAVRAIVLLRKN